MVVFSLFSLLWTSCTSYISLNLSSNFTLPSSKKGNFHSKPEEFRTNSVFILIPILTILRAIGRGWKQCIFSNPGSGNIQMKFHLCWKAIGIWKVQLSALHQCLHGLQVKAWRQEWRAGMCWGVCRCNGRVVGWCHWWIVAVSSLCCGCVQWHCQAPDVGHKSICAGAWCWKFLCSYTCWCCFGECVHQVGHQQSCLTYIVIVDEGSIICWIAHVINALKLKNGRRSWLELGAVDWCCDGVIGGVIIGIQSWSFDFLP